MALATERRQKFIKTALWTLLGIATVFGLSLAPSAFESTQAGWQFNDVVRSANDVPYEALTALITGVRFALGGLSLATAMALLTLRSQTGSLLAALALMTMPFTFGLFGNAGMTTYPPPWQELLGALNTLLAFGGAITLLALLFLFPDGHLYPARLRVPALAGLLLTAAGAAVAYRFENAWWVFIVTLLLTIALGIIGQVLRYRAAEATQRQQMAGLMAILLAVLLSALTNALGLSQLLSLTTYHVLLAMLPLGLYLGARRGLWGERPPHRLWAGSAVLLALSAVTVAGFWWHSNQPATIDVAALATDQPIPVLLDTDMAMDDIGALFYLLQHPAIDLRAITVNGVAFAHCDAGVHNTLGLLEVARAPEIPVSCGREEPYPGGRPAPDGWRKSADALYGAQVRTGERHADQRPAAKLLANTIAAAPGEIVVVALGPLTNLAEAFQAEPSLASQIKEIIIMGGAVAAPGNVTDGDPANQVSEWNFFADPVAADIVLASGAPITLVPLDATNQVPFTRGFYQRLKAGHLSRSATFTYNLLYLNQWWLDGGMYWWDTLAAAVITDPGLVRLEEMALDVVTDQGSEMGRSIETANGSPVRVATDADRQAFEGLFLAVLNYE